MCGRFCCSLTPELLQSKLYKDHITHKEETKWIQKEKYRPSYNICPSRNVLTLYKQDEQVLLECMQWGYIPSWSRNISMSKPINARLETLLDKSMFDQSKHTKRCIIIAEGFYEWKKLSATKKQAHYVKRKDGALMVFAGLYDTNTYIGDGKNTCVIITTHASDFFTTIHHRMPVILDHQNIDTWLNEKNEWSQVCCNLKPYDRNLDCYQVTDEVGNVQKDAADFIVPMDTKKSSISYFLRQEEPKAKFDKFKLEQEFNGSVGSNSNSNSKKRKATSIVEDFKSSQQAKKKNVKITSFFSKK